MKSIQGFPVSYLDLLLAAFASIFTISICIAKIKKPVIIPKKGEFFLVKVSYSLSLLNNKKIFITNATPATNRNIGDIIIDKEEEVLIRDTFNNDDIDVQLGISVIHKSDSLKTKHISIFNNMPHFDKLKKVFTKNKRFDNISLHEGYRFRKKAQDSSNDEINDTRLKVLYCYIEAPAPGNWNWKLMYSKINNTALPKLKINIENIEIFNSTEKVYGLKGNDVLFLDVEKNHVKDINFTAKVTN